MLQKHLSRDHGNKDEKESDDSEDAVSVIPMMTQMMMMMAEGVETLRLEDECLPLRESLAVSPSFLSYLSFFLKQACLRRSVGCLRDQRASGVVVEIRDDRFVDAVTAADAR